MTEYEKLITAEQIAHTVEITECLTGKTGMANTCAGRVALFYGAEDGNDDKIVKDAPSSSAATSQTHAKVTLVYNSISGLFYFIQFQDFL